MSEDLSAMQAEIDGLARRLFELRVAKERAAVLADTMTVGELVDALAALPRETLIVSVKMVPLQHDEYGNLYPHPLQSCKLEEMGWRYSRMVGLLYLFAPPEDLPPDEMQLSEVLAGGNPTQRAGEEE